MNGLAEKRQIESLDFETEILANVKEERLRLERIFSEREGVSENKLNRKRVLELASVGEYWIAKSMLLEQLNSEPDNEEILETMAVLETYILDAENRNYWCDRLLDLFPGVLPWRWWCRFWFLFSPCSDWFCRVAAAVTVPKLDVPCALFMQS